MCHSLRECSMNSLPGAALHAEWQTYDPAGFRFLLAPLTRLVLAGALALDSLSAHGSRSAAVMDGPCPGTHGWGKGHKLAQSLQNPLSYRNNTEPVVSASFRFGFLHKVLLLVVFAICNKHCQLQQ